ncbi:hypothetical protein [Candidatus Cetobacterium colombiensis]|uniref:Uncharacterized protein n=1 Tax=Candidatus Cetobacterium colombiensis TaxID=3073100 RepID=A0ABU4WAL6_9FUSO|nr:hypothetical protein [Candidatus Cetobacterium colombiensis]MDX8336588.1 hypothetical protein [Candidatus Cetobacterium colombiensis]
MEDKHQLFIATLKQDQHILKNMSEKEIENYFFEFLKKYHGKFAFRKSLCRTTNLKPYTIDNAISEKILTCNKYNEDESYQVFCTKEFAKVVSSCYITKLKRGGL